LTQHRQSQTAQLPNFARAGILFERVEVGSNYLSFVGDLEANLFQRQNIKGLLYLDTYVFDAQEPEAK